MSKRPIDSWALLEERVVDEIERNTFSRLSNAWDEFKALLGTATPEGVLYLTRRDRLDLAVSTERLLFTLVVDSKHFLVAAVELEHVKGVDIANREGSSRRGTEVQLSVWFLDNTRFYYESGLENLEQMRRFAQFIRRGLGQGPGDSAD